MGPSRLRKDGVATLVRGTWSGSAGEFFSTLNLDVPHVKCVKSYQRRKKTPRMGLCEALGMVMRFPLLCERSVPHTLPSVTPWIC